MRSVAGSLGGSAGAGAVAIVVPAERALHKVARRLELGHGRRGAPDQTATGSSSAVTEASELLQSSQRCAATLQTSPLEALV